MSEKEGNLRSTEPDTQTIAQDTTINKASEAFTNKQITLSNISTHDLEFSPLSLKYKKINILFYLIFGLVSCLVIIVLASNFLFKIPENLETSIPYAFGIVVFLSLWGILYHYFADPLKMYSVREHDLNYQSGLVFRSLVSQPILRIQHIEIKRGPIERKAGLASLQVFSAGGAAHTFYIPGLEHDKAISLRQFILDHKDIAKDV